MIPKPDPRQSRSGTAVGADVGIPADRIERAAHDLERRTLAPPARTTLGVPRSVVRILPLRRGLDDPEWDRLVADLRTTFEAVGKVTTHGSLRSWSNGNLQAHEEPDGDGWRLRMQTFKGDTAPLALTSGAFALIGMLIFLLSYLDGSAGREMIVSLVFMAVGFGQLAFLRLSLPRWADERASQMEAVAERLQGRLASSATELTQPGDESEP